MLDTESIIRLRKGFEIYRRANDKERKNIYFVSSVQDSLNKKYPSQAELMKRWLEALGVPKEQIVIKNQSSSTMDDIRNSFKIVETKKLPYPIINVSSWYHIPRIWLMWFLLRKQLGYPELRYVLAGVVNYSWILLEPGKIIRLLYLRHKSEHFF